MAKQDVHIIVISIVGSGRRKTIDSFPSEWSVPRESVSGLSVMYPGCDVISEKILVGNVF